jgi:ribose transport system substrate-binding protein
MLAASGPTTAAATDEPPLEIAFIPAAAATCYDTPLLAAAQAAATAGDANLTVLVPEEPRTQPEELRDAVASGAYDGIVVQPPLGTGLADAVVEAVAVGIPVANVDRVLGSDMTSAAAQVPGLAANVVFLPSELGHKLGQLALEACAASGPGPCEVGYLFSSRDPGLGQALRSAFDAAVAADPDLSVVAEATDAFLPAAGLAAVRAMLAQHPDLDVIVGSDQAVTGALQAASEADRTGEIAMVGYGGGAVAVQGVQSGERFATVMQLPGTEGRLVVEQLLSAIRSGQPSPGIDALAQLPDDGVVRADNAAAFVPEWPG